MDLTLRLAPLLRLGMYTEGMVNWFTLDLLVMWIIGLARIDCIEAIGELKLCAELTQKLQISEIFYEDSVKFTNTAYSTTPPMLGDAMNEIAYIELKGSILWWT